MGTTHCAPSPSAHRTRSRTDVCAPRGTDACFASRPAPTRVATIGHAWCLRRTSQSRWDVPAMGVPGTADDVRLLQPVALEGRLAQRDAHLDAAKGGMILPLLRHVEELDEWVAVEPPDRRPQRV